MLSLALAIRRRHAERDAGIHPTLVGREDPRRAGNDAAEIARADALEVTVTPDTRAPAVLGIPTVDGATLVVNFDEALDDTSIPAAPGGLTLTVQPQRRQRHRADGERALVVVLGTVLTLTLSQAVRGGDAVTLAYAKPSTPLRDRATTPNELTNFTTGTGGRAGGRESDAVSQDRSLRGHGAGLRDRRPGRGRYRLHPGGARDRDLIGPARALAHDRHQHPQGALRLGHGAARRSASNT